MPRIHILLKHQHICTQHQVQKQQFCYCTRHAATSHQLLVRFFRANACSYYDPALASLTAFKPLLRYFFSHSTRACSIFNAFSNNAVYKSMIYNKQPQLSSINSQVKLTTATLPLIIIHHKENKYTLLLPRVVYIFWLYKYKL